MTTRFLLAGDVGATKTKLGLFSLEGNFKTPEAEETYPSADYPDLESIVRMFLSAKSASPDYASFGVAGPVIAGRAKITNLPWTVEATKLAEEVGLSEVHLVNDLEAIATVVPFLSRSETSTLNAGSADQAGSVAVIAPGSGLGEAFITRDGPHYRVHPSEGGHADFAPTNPTQVELLRYMMERNDHVSVEQVCSGLGIKNVHSYFKAINPGAESSRHERELDSADDPVPLIAGSALGNGDERCEVCSATFETFSSILGAEAGNLALKVLATGGVYVGGGIPRKVLPILREGPFVASFRNKGRLSALVSRIPVHVILSPRAALVGAALSGMESLGRTGRRVPQAVRGGR